jgi:hypothetical protein
MKRQLLAIALGSLVALPALANNEIDAGYAAGTTFSADNAGLVFADAEQGYVPAAGHGAGKSRADVRAEVEQTRRSGNYVVNAELGTKANPL